VSEPKASGQGRTIQAVVDEPEGGIRTFCTFSIHPSESSFRRLEAFFKSSFTRKRSAFAAALWYPCFQAPLASPLGAPPRAPWKRQTSHPRTAGALQRWPVLLDLAVHRGAFWKAYPCFFPFMRLPSNFFIIPTLRRDVAHDGLASVMNMHMFNGDLLLSAGPIPL
jgi:hypothetical protein